MSRRDAAMTGVAADKLPDQLAERWAFKCKDTVEAAPAVVALYTALLRWLPGREAGRATRAIRSGPVDESRVS